MGNNVNKHVYCLKMKCGGLLFISSVYYYLVSNVSCTQYPSYKDSVGRKSSVNSNVKEISNDRNEPRTSIAPPLADTILVSLNVVSLVIF